MLKTLFINRNVNNYSRIALFVRSNNVSLLKNSDSTRMMALTQD